jgi:glycosyltransferase involved in cell wall biosynthesis
MNEVRVLHLVGDSRYGGGAQIILPLALRAQGESWHVDVMATDRVLQQAIRNAGVGVVDLDVIRRKIRFLWDFVGLIRLARFLLRNPYTIVHTHTSKAGFVGRLAAALAGVPVIIHTVHGFAFHESSGRTARIVYSAMERMAAHWCDAIVCVSHFHRDWALKLRIGTPAKVVAIPNGLALDRASVTKPRAEVRRELGLADGELAIFSAGRLARQKGFEYLIRATAELVHRLNRPFRVVIAGEGELLDSLRRLCHQLGVAHHVTFLGFRNDLGNLLSAADLVVLPSLWEGLSIALLEAMAAGKPIVTTRIGSNMEVVRNEETALVVEPANVPELVDGILRCTADEAFASELGQKALLRFRGNYTQERMLRGYLHLYRQTIESNKSPNPSHRQTLEPSRNSGVSPDEFSI